jgi:PTH1 family peptidyl-tRNA hydrolase
VGLGNPGNQYSRNRHNLGFMVVDRVLEKYQFPPFRAKFNGEASIGLIGSNKTLILKPTTFMNESGRSVAAAVNFYKLKTEQVTVIHDDLDLSFGKIRIKKSGGHGGHNGLRSIDNHIGSNYQRIRIGIGHPGERRKVIDYVLADFQKEDANRLKSVIEAIVSQINLGLRGDDVEFMNKIILVMEKIKLDRKEIIV